MSHYKTKVIQKDSNMLSTKGLLIVVVAAILAIAGGSMWVHKDEVGGKVIDDPFVTEEVVQTTEVVPQDPVFEEVVTEIIAETINDAIAEEAAIDEAVPDVVPEPVLK